eukprot:c6008_g1_i1 orf=19-210(+)
MGLHVYACMPLVTSTCIIRPCLTFKSHITTCLPSQHMHSHSHNHMYFSCLHEFDRIHMHHFGC